MSGKAMVAALNGQYLVRHAWLTCSGTGAAPGTGYPSWVLQNADPSLVYEVPVIAPWSFGFVPVAGSTNPMAASYDGSVQIAVNWMTAWLQQNPYQTFGIGGYSQGAEAASIIRMALSPGGPLNEFFDNYIGGFTLGNPRRMAGHTTSDGAPDPGGSGISTTLMTENDLDLAWWDEANGPANGASGIDMYTACPNNGAGVIIRTFYVMCTQLQLSDPLSMFQAVTKGIVQLLHEILPTKGGGLIGTLEGLIGDLAVLGSLASAGAGILQNGSIPNLTQSVQQLPSLAQMGVGLVDAIEAAIIALKFFGSGTAPHVTYDTTFSVPATEPGVTHIAHLVQHVNTCCLAVPARMAA